MVQTAIKPSESATKPFVVLRALCMAGERVEVGEIVQLTNSLSIELMTATKVAPEGSAAADAAVKSLKEAKAAAARQAKEAKAAASKAEGEVSEKLVDFAADGAASTAEKSA